MILATHYDRTAVPHNQQRQRRTTTCTIYRHIDRRGEYPDIRRI